MNDKIKEILDFKENADYKRLSCDEIKVLKDYINNLQQELKIMIKDDERSQETIIRLTKENERLKDNRDWWKDRFFGQQEYDDSHRITAIEYKKRIDKAIEFINKYCIDDEFYVNLTHKEKAIIEVLNILQNGSDDNE